jgi:hypothetical protein
LVTVRVTVSTALFVRVRFSPAIVTVPPGTVSVTVSVTVVGLPDTVVVSVSVTVEAGTVVVRVDPDSVTVTVEPDTVDVTVTAG